MFLGIGKEVCGRFSKNWIGGVANPYARFRRFPRVGWPASPTLRVVVGVTLSAAKMTSLRGTFSVSPNPGSGVTLRS